MSVKEIRAIVKRVDTWSDDKQELALALLEWIEGRDLEDDHELTPEEWADLEGGLAEADRGEFVSEEEMQAFFAKYKHK
jgi:predicted transcriptional regulator